MSLSPASHIPLLQSPDPVMLISVAAIRGSTPREAGAFMLITADAASGTIGGGNLEHQVIKRVRNVLNDPANAPGAAVVRYPLGPGLGQCCGGSVEIAFHLFGADEKRILRELLATVTGGDVGDAGRWAMLPLDRSALGGADRHQARILCEAFDGGRGGIVSVNGVQTLCLRLDEALTPVWIFGAGHVGQALVTALAPLPFDLYLVDSRAAYLTMPETEKCQLYQSDMPEKDVVDIPAGAFVLIVTHNHAQDFDICRAALKRDDLGFVGMIGSQTKRARFVRRLSERGLNAHEIARLTCPIGIQGVTGKQPAVIAASVAAQMLSLREAWMARIPADEAGEGGAVGL